MQCQYMCMCEKGTQRWNTACVTDWGKN